MPKIAVPLKNAGNRDSSSQTDLKQFGWAHCHMTDKSLVVQTLGFFFFLFSGQQKKQVKKNKADRGIS